MSDRRSRIPPSPPPPAGEVDAQSSSEGAPRDQSPGPPPQAGEGADRAKPKRPKRDVDGWLVLDKPVGMTSTHAVAVVKRAFAARKAGHAGTLDPLASGVLPIALGEATKTVPFVMDGHKVYRFLVRWGIETDTDDAEGSAVATSDARPDADAIRAALPRFIGAIMQTPPKFSAVKIAGERAYDLARAGEEVTIAPRPVEIGRLDLVAVPDADHAAFEAECGKGTYVRALARDLGRLLGTRGHVAALRRTAVGPFTERIAIPPEALPNPEDDGPQPRHPNLLPVSAGLAGLPALSVSRADAARLARGQPVILRGRDAPVVTGWAAVATEGQLIALVEGVEGELCPRRIFNLRDPAAARMARPE